MRPAVLDYAGSKTKPPGRNWAQAARAVLAFSAGSYLPALIWFAVAYGAGYEQDRREPPKIDDAAFALAIIAGYASIVVAVGQLVAIGVFRGEPGRPRWMAALVAGVSSSLALVISEFLLSAPSLGRTFDWPIVLGLLVLPVGLSVVLARNSAGRRGPRGAPRVDDP